MESRPRSPVELRRWTPEEEHHLIYLRDQEQKTFDYIGSIINRSATATQARYSVIKQRQISSVVNWTTETDHTIIDGRRRALTTKEIAADMQLPSHAVLERWYTLQRLKQVPEDDLLVWRRKANVAFTPEEDEVILKIWMQMRNDEQLTRMVKFKGRSQADIRERRIELVHGHSPLYLKMLGVGGVGDGKENESDALKVALGKPKYSWMK